MKALVNFFASLRRKHSAPSETPWQEVSFRCGMPHVWAEELRLAEEFERQDRDPDYALGDGIAYGPKEARAVMELWLILAMQRRHRQRPSC